MKHTQKLGLVLSGILTIFAVSANAGTLNPSKNSAFTIDRNGQHIAATSATKILNGDIITAHKGNAVLTYKNCRQTLTQSHFVKVVEGNSCSSIKAIDASKVARIDPETAGLGCTNCKTKLASKASMGKYLLIGSAVVLTAVIIDNHDSSSD